LTFTPAPMQGVGSNGWGAVGLAAGGGGYGARVCLSSARTGRADGFAEAWDIAIAMGADTQFHGALDRAIHGVTTIRVLRGGSVDVTNAPDRKLLNAAFSPGNRVFRLHKAKRETR